MSTFKSSEIAKRFGIPVKTAYNWSVEKDSWRKRLYLYLEKQYAKELMEATQDH